MLPATAALCAWLPAILGFGSLARVEGGPLRRTGAAGAVGLGVLAAIAVALHLVVPLSAGASLVALAAGWILFLRARSRLLSGVAPRHLAFAAGLVLALAALAQLPARHYDSGLYLLQSVRWAREHAVVPGLASLHPRLGYDSSWLALAAMVEAPGLGGRSSFFLNALPVAFAAFLAADAVGRLRAGDRRASTYYFALAAFAAALGVDTLGSLYPDQPVAILAVLSLGLWLCAAEEPAELARLALPGALLAAFAFTAKISSAVLLAAWAALLLGRRGALDRRARLGLAAAAAAVLVPWMARGLLTSGCLLFPATWSCVPSLPWATPHPMVAATDAVIRAWARWPGAPVDLALAGWAWFPGWARSTLALPHVAIPVVGLALGVVAMRGGLLRSPVRTPLLVALAGVAFWMATAPSPRFGLMYLLPAAMLAVAAWAHRREPTAPPWARRAALVLTVLAAGAYLQWSVRPLRKLRWDTVALARWPALPAVAVERRASALGAEVSVPVAGDQCWAADPPCTPGFPLGLAWQDGSYRVLPVGQVDR